jgi:hypothetical protein
MEQNKTSRYLKYAIGEILLVVIGILIALQINNWNQNRQDQKQQVKLIVQLLEDAQIDSVFYASRLTLFEGQIKSYDALFDMCQRGFITKKDTMLLLETEEPFKSAADKSNIIININDYSKVSDTEIKAALRDYNINYGYIDKAIDVHTQTVWTEFSALVKDFNLTSLESTQQTLSQYFPVCEDSRIQGKIHLCTRITNNAKKQTERFIAGNTQMIKVCRDYLSKYQIE